MKYARVSLVATLTFLASFFAIATEHPLGELRGPGIDLKAYDHAIAGAVRDFVIWGEVNEEEFTSKLLIRQEGRTIETVFKKRDDGKIGGAIQGNTTLTLVKVDHKNAKLVLDYNGTPFELAITADHYDGHHFHNPSYHTMINGEPIQYTLQGEACYGFSLHLAFLVLGSYLH